MGPYGDQSESHFDLVLATIMAINQQLALLYFQRVRNIFHCKEPFEHNEIITGRKMLFIKNYFYTLFSQVYHLVIGPFFVNKSEEIYDAKNDSISV